MLSCIHVCLKFMEIGHEIISTVRLTDCLDMTLVVEWDVEQQNKQKIQFLVEFLHMSPVMQKLVFGDL